MNIKNCLMTFVRTILVCLLVLPVIGCVNSLQPVDARFKPDADTVVVYGRFALDHQEAYVCLRIYNTETRKEILLPMRQYNPVYGTQIPAGMYQITGTAIVDIENGNHNAPLSGKDGPTVLPFTAERGTAVYLGDFSCYGTLINYNIRLLTNNYAATTELFHTMYPNLTSLRTVSILQPGQNPIP